MREVLQKEFGLFGPFTDFLGGNETLVYSLLAASFITFVLTLLAVPWIVVRIPHDYFSRGARAIMPPIGNRLLHLSFILLKNLLGIVFLVMGLGMLVLPGQGLLTILIGVMLLDFPGKYSFECWLVSRGPILRSVNWLRTRFGRRPLEF